MTQKINFYDSLFHLINDPNEELSYEKKLDLIEKVISEKKQLKEFSNPITCDFIPFIRGRWSLNPSPSLRSSDNISLLFATNIEDNHTYLLYTIKGLEYQKHRIEEFNLQLSLTFSHPEGNLTVTKEIQPQIFNDDYLKITDLENIALSETNDKTLVIKLNPNKDFCHDQLDKYFGFETFFQQKILVELKINHSEIPIAYTHIYIHAFNVRKFSSLYSRIIKKIISKDYFNQANKVHKEDFKYQYHPLYPCVEITKNKDELYNRELFQGILKNKHVLTNPLWLLQVSIHLEFLTALGIFEALKYQFGELLNPDERHALEYYPDFKKIKDKINIKGWKEIWQNHEVIYTKFGTPNLGDVSSQNLLKKRTVYLSFLAIQKIDLLNAIELTGSNLLSSQEALHHYFRDFERAILNTSQDVYPEINELDNKNKNFILWHNKNNPDTPTFSWMSSLFGYQDGLFVFLSDQYREILNEVANWAKNKQLIEFLGKDCIPHDASLIYWLINDNMSRFGELQQNDGYSSQIETEFLEETTSYSQESKINPETLNESIFKILSKEDCQLLIDNSRKINLGPLERIVIEGEKGSSLFIVGEGALEVLKRQKDGTDLRVNTIYPGDIIGEMSLLTGEPRSATVRSISRSTVYEIGKKQYEPLIKARPEIVEDLASIMLERTIQTQNLLNLPKQTKETIHQKIWNFFFNS